MSKVVFLFNGLEMIIPCNKDEKLKEICKRFALKTNNEINNIYFLYNGNKINEELKFNELANREDNERNTMNILVYEINKTIIKDNIIKLNEIICPKCNENILVKIEDYKINLFDCKNNHNIRNILLKEYDNISKIDISKIKCDICKIKNKSNTYNNIFYTCPNCCIYLCPLCKENHNKNHKIINYEHKNYICNKHNEAFTKYCYECKKNICIRCEKEHQNHKDIYYGKIIPDDNNNDELKKYIDELNDEINNIIGKLNNIKDNIEIYYNICNNFIFYNNSNKSNENLQNINEFLNYNNYIVKDIKEIITEDNIENKVKNLMILYNKIQNNNNYIIAEIDIKEDDIDKDIKIINSFEKTKRDEGWEDEEDDYKCENEKEIKDNCEIMINNKKIPFSYVYKFSKVGKYIIKYSFKNNITKTSCLFYGCSSLTYIDLSNFNAQNITNMVSMFRDCLNLKKINLSNFKSQNVTDIGAMFYGCKSLAKIINLSDFNSQNISNMANLFYKCSSLNDIDLSNFNILKVSDMVNMFFGCSSLKKIYLSNLNLKILLTWIECSLDIGL